MIFDDIEIGRLDYYRAATNAEVAYANIYLRRELTEPDHIRERSPVADTCWQIRADHEMMAHKISMRKFHIEMNHIMERELIHACR
jgi:hypothetical protein